MTDQIVLSGTEFTPVSWQPKPDMAYDEWEHWGTQLAKAGAAINWWIGDWLNYGENVYGETYAQALGLFEGQYEYQTLRQLKWVASAVEMSLRRDILSWYHHKEVAALGPEDQAAFLTLATESKWSVRELRSAVALLKTSQAPALETVAGTYSILYADPPWRYEHSKTNSRRIENQYPTMALDEICALPVSSVAAPDSLLFMWATSPKLLESMQVLESWGFDYRTCLVWVKDKIGMGYYARQRHELLLVAKRGDFPPPEPANRFDSVIESPRTKHSQKPEQVYSMIETMYPAYAKLELFARSSRENWAAWGNENA